MKGFGARRPICLAFALVSTIPAFAGSVTFTCSENFDAAFDPGGGSVCSYLNNTIAPEYGNTFSNVNANIYIDTTTQGLADSTTGAFNLVTYSTYQTALESLSTDAVAMASVPGAEPGIFDGEDINLTSALAEALGITTTVNNTRGAVEGITAGDANCTNFATPGSGCYNGIIQVVTPAALEGEEAGQGFDYRTLGGTTDGSTSNYDFFGVVEHETDEILGTASCVDTTNGTSGISSSGSFCASAVDLFRYTSPGTRTFVTTGVNAYFSPDGGATDYQGNTYNDLANGEDWADFSQSCTFVQDAVGCPNGATFDVLTDGIGGTVGPEVAILNAVGYNLVAPEPGTLGMLGFGLTALIVIAFRRDRVL